ncbi:MAG: NADH:flavin oxidoreductase [Deltaproteobacteria bacterium]|nr:NADH:flavin oxidoreductase [Deltaproteobacteria bacterium]
MRGLFESGSIGSLRLSNRFVRSATWSGMASDDGACTSKLTGLKSSLARGGVGLIITGHAYVRPDGQAGPWQLGVYKDDLIPGLRTMTDTVHREGGKILMQMSHAGFFSHPKLTGKTPLAPSIVEGFAKSPRNELTLEDIQGIVDAFGKAALRAKQAGFDGIQLHAAHGYLLSQFLSPAFNKRTDSYGGSIDNRARALMEVLETVRKAVGEDYPVLVKMNSQDYLDGGLSLEDSVQVGQMLAGAGIDAIELSGGTIASGDRNPNFNKVLSEEQEAFFRDAAGAFKKEIDVPLILVGGIRSYHLAEKILAEGLADYISLCRPLIREPGLVNRWKAGDLRKATCISDNSCLGAAMSGEGLYCVVERKAEKAGTNAPEG